MLLIKCLFQFLKIHRKVFLLCLNHYIEFANDSLLKKPKTYLYPFLKNILPLIYDKMASLNTYFALYSIQVSLVMLCYVIS